MTSSPSACQSIHSLLQSTIDGLSATASERPTNTWLVNQDGTILHRSHDESASRVNHTESVVPSLVSLEEWNSMVEGSVVASARFRLLRLGSCPCGHCNDCQTYYCFVEGETAPPGAPLSSPSCDHHHHHNKYQETVDAAFDPMFEIDGIGTILLINRAAMEQFGYTREELIGNNIEMLCGGDHGPKHRSYMKRYLETGVAHIIGTKRRVMAKRKDGTEFPIELGIRRVSSSVSAANTPTGGGAPTAAGGFNAEEVHNPRQTYFCGCLRDVTREVEHERELLEQELRLEGMINASFDPMFEIDETGVIRVVNDAACHMFGWSREELLGSNISMICGGEHGPRHDSYLRRYLETGEKRIIGRKRKIKGKRKDGSEFDIELGVQEVVLGGSGNDSKTTRAFCGYVRDLTQQYMDKRALQKTERMVKSRFFGSDDGDTSNNENS